MTLRRAPASIAGSIASGVAFASACAVASGFADALIYAWVIGGAIGFVMSPLAYAALADSECHVSFGWVFWPTFWATALISVADPALGMFASVIVYASANIGAAAVAAVRRRQLDRYNAGHCTFCGYDLSGVSGEICPECGRGPSVRPAIRVSKAVLRP